jgi:uncharacterized membrane protein YhaH (DUF805 family)
MAQRDSGAQPERTLLAWRRTVLALSVVATLAARMALHNGVTPWRLAGLFAIVIVWFIAITVAWRRLHALGRPQPLALARTVTTAGACTVVLALLASLGVIMNPPA